MAAKCFLLGVILCIFSSSCIPNPVIAASSKGFLHCLVSHGIPSGLLLTRSSPSYTSVLNSSIRNPVFLNVTSSTSRPLYIITPKKDSHVQAAVRCGRRHRTRLRVRSGGHDYEGLSYRSADRRSRGGRRRRHELFAVVDLSRMRSVRVDARRGTAWVQSGATLGELYHGVWREAPRFGFPAGVCPTVGVGGHFSGGGFGMLQRRYGLAADHVVNATLVDARGRLLHRGTMGEDLFWAIRGGGGGSFGVLLSWQVNLVSVPSTVTLFIIDKPLDQDATTNTLIKWQSIAPNLPEDIMIRAIVRLQSVEFQSMYLGTCSELLPLMRRRFPDLGVNRTHCREMTWIESIPYMHLGSNATLADILNRSSVSDTNTKNKSDYVTKAIPRAAWKKILGRVQSAATTFGGYFEMFLDPYGGRIGAVDESATPFPHRRDVLYNIQYITFWTGDANGTRAMEWSRELYEFMEAYVSKNPRRAYVNYRDLELGTNTVVDSGVSSYRAGKVWGERYFKHNFERLAAVKAKVDPHDYFRNEQSIPPLFK